MITWTIGSSGLLGSALERGRRSVFNPGAISWRDATLARRQLAEGVQAFARRAQDDPWRILWAAGRATVSTTDEETRDELLALRTLVTELAERGPSGPGTFFLASSAGGVYAGSHPAPFDAGSAVVPISPYGRLKAAQEAEVRALGTRCAVVIGRIANLYGPSQRLDKAQGLISLLVHAAATRRSLNIFVPLDTLRDYVFVHDAAMAIHAACDRAIAPGTTVEVIASGRPVTIGYLIRLVETVTKRKVPVALGSHSSAGHQVHDLRLVPSIAVDDPTGLPAGIRLIFADAVRRLQQTQAFA